MHCLCDQCKHNHKHLHYNSAVNNNLTAETFTGTLVNTLSRLTERTAIYSTTQIRHLAVTSHALIRKNPPESEAQVTQQVPSTPHIQKLWFTTPQTTHCTEVWILWWARGCGLKDKAAGQAEPITPCSPEPHTSQQPQCTSRSNCAFWNGATHLFAAFIYFQLSYGTDFPHRNACSFIQKIKRRMSFTL